MLAKQVLSLSGLMAADAISMMSSPTIAVDQTRFSVVSYNVQFDAGGFIEHDKDKYDWTYRDPETGQPIMKTAEKELKMSPDDRSLAQNETKKNIMNVLFKNCGYEDEAKDENDGKCQPRHHVSLVQEVSPGHMPAGRVREEMINMIKQKATKEKPLINIFEWNQYWYVMSLQDTELMVTILSHAQFGEITTADVLAHDFRREDGRGRRPYIVVNAKGYSFVNFHALHPRNGKDTGAFVQEKIFDFISEKSNTYILLDDKVKAIKDFEFENKIIAGGDCNESVNALKGETLDEVANLTFNKKPLSYTKPVLTNPTGGRGIWNEAYKGQNDYIFTTGSLFDAKVINTINKQGVNTHSNHFPVIATYISDGGEPQEFQVAEEQTTFLGGTAGLRVGPSNGKQHEGIMSTEGEVKCNAADLPKMSNADLNKCTIITGRVVVGMEKMSHDHNPEVMGENAAKWINELVNVEEMEFLQIANTELTKISLPKLKSVGDLANLKLGNDLEIKQNNKLQTLDLGKLEYSYAVNIRDNEILQSVNFPELKNIGLRSVDIVGNKNVETIDLKSLKKCEKLTLNISENEKLNAIDLSALESLHILIVENNANLEKLDLPNLKDASYNFLSVSYNSKMQELNVPELSSVVGLRVFGNASERRLGTETTMTLNLPKLTEVGEFGFEICGNEKLVEIDFPKLVTSGKFDIQSNKSLQTVKLPSLKKVNAEYHQRINGNDNLSKVVLNKDLKKIVAKDFMDSYNNRNLLIIVESKIHDANNERLGKTLKSIDGLVTFGGGNLFGIW